MSALSIRNVAIVCQACFLFLTACAGSQHPEPGGPAAAAPTTEKASAPDGTEAKLRAALGGAHRPEADKARDVYRHPVETLQFFGLRETMNVVEIYPGRGGWYTSILAPVLAEKGKLTTTNFDPKTDGPRGKYGQAFAKLMADHPAVFGKVDVRILRAGEELSFGPENSADMVVTFRNVHGWLGDKSQDKVVAAALKVLKPGGIFGVVEHRAKPDADPALASKTGYVAENFVIRMVEGGGFKLAGKSEINANPKDTKDHPKGVWTLPPSLRLGDTDRAKYQAIGESDRMTLRFVKPKG